jgi:hypothetical protein
MGGIQSSTRNSDLLLIEIPKDGRLGCGFIGGGPINLETSINMVLAQMLMNRKLNATWGWKLLARSVIVHNF